MNVKHLLLGFTLSAGPLFAFAQPYEKSIKGIIGYILEILGELLIPLMIAFALFMFIWGVADFIRNAENSEERRKGKQRMVWGILALFFMIAFLGLTSILTRTFFNESPLLPLFYENS